MSGGFYVGAFIIVAAVVLMPFMNRRKVAG